MRSLDSPNKWKVGNQHHVLVQVDLVAGKHMRVVVGISFWR